MVFGKRNDKKKPAAKADAASPKAPAPVGATSGVSVSETWIQVFERNEQVGEHERLTDAQISDRMKAEFPGVDAKLFDRVEIAPGGHQAVSLLLEPVLQAALVDYMLRLWKPVGHNLCWP